VVIHQIDLVPKRLEMLRELLPNARSVGIMFHPVAPAEFLATAEAAAGTLGFDVQLLRTRTESEIEQAFTRLAESRAEALLVAADALFYAQREQIFALAARFRQSTLSRHLSLRAVS
jgi:putative ABC transport system substrate-binding protein